MSSALRVVVLCLVLVVLSHTQHANAQQFTPRSSSVARSTTSYLINRPTVSPYLNLLRADSEVAMPNYHTLVRPAVESRRQTAEQASQIRGLRSNVTNMQGRLAGQSRGSQFSTGHPTRFMTYLHYYPSLRDR